MKVLYVTSNGGIHDYRFLKKLSDDYEVLLLHYAARDIISEIHGIKNLKIISKKPVIRTFPYLSERSHFKKIYNDFKPDITHTGYVWQVGILASHFNIHPHLSMVWGSDVLLEPDRKWYYRKMVRRVLRQADHIQCDAGIVKNKMISDYGLSAEKITVFPWGIDLNLFKPMDKLSCRKTLGLDEKKFIVIFNRFLEPVYGVMDLLEGFRLFSRNKNDVLLIMLSDGSLKNSVHKYVKDKNLGAKINPMGRIANTELPGYLNAADIYISTAFSDGTSLSLLEAMACSKPVILTDLHAIRDWASETNAIMVQPGNIEQIASAFERYYGAKNVMQEHGQQSLEIAQERADWNKNYLKLKEIYKDLLKG